MHSWRGVQRGDLAPRDLSVRAHAAARDPEAGEGSADLATLLHGTWGTMYPLEEARILSDHDFDTVVAQCAGGRAL